MAEGTNPGVAETEALDHIELKKLDEVELISPRVIEEALKLVEADKREDEKLQKKKILLLKSVQDAMEKVQASENHTFEVKDSEGNSQQEGVPVDGMINYLLEEIDPESEAEFTKKGDNNTLRNEVLAQVMYPFNRLSHLEKKKVDESEQKIIENIDFILDRQTILSIHRRWSQRQQSLANQA